MPAKDRNSKNSKKISTKVSVTRSNTKSSSQLRPKKRPLIKVEPESIKPYHAKPYRKRHYGLLMLSLVASSFLLIILITTLVSNSNTSKSTRDILADLFGIKSGQQTSQLSTTVSSTYGFSLQYDQLKLYASAVDSKTGSLYVGNELSTSRAYSSVRLAPTLPDPKSPTQSGSINIQYYSGKPSGQLTKLEAEILSKANPSFIVKTSTNETIDGVEFLKSEWQSKPMSGVAANFKSSLTSYIGIVNGSPFTITLRTDSVFNETSKDLLNSVVESLKFGQPTPVSTLPEVNLEQASSNLNLLDKLTFTGSASAAATAQPSSSEKISTLYSPAVVKVYNVYCMDILVNGQPYIYDSCQGSTGSGFFVGNEGYVATNGHVVASHPLDIAIMHSLQQLSDGDSSYFDKLIELSGLTEADLANATTNAQKLSIIADKFYAIPESTFSSTNSVSNLLVDLGEKQPDVQELVNMTKAREKYPEQDTIKQAELKAYDYRALDGANTGVFKSSDVALLKIDGSGYPAVKLGSISNLAQGSGLSIIGYPAMATSNPLVDNTQSRATLTSGKVSSIKNATGSAQQLIETDATIGHGNSGGPAFSDSGEVVGIATYTIDGSGDGNGVFNYIRDIADLSQLASKSSINIDGANNQTQTKWQKGVDLFYQAKYSKALKEFAKVKELYPQHPGVDRLVAVSQQRIASGEEAKDFPVLLVAGSTVIFIALSGLAVVLIIRHKKYHELFKQSPEQSAPPLAPSPTPVTASPPSSTQPSPGPAQSTIP